MRYFLVTVPDHAIESDDFSELEHYAVTNFHDESTVAEARYAGDLPKLATAPARRLYVVEREA